MKFINKLYNWYGKKTVWGVVTLVIILLVTSVIYSNKNNAEVVTDEPLPTVRVAPAGSQNSEATLELIGTVKAVSQAELEAEISGRITSVNVGLGDTVRAGQIIATQDNAGERAAVLQAEGVYEAALASAAQSSVSVDQANTSLISARVSAVSALRSAYIDNDDIVRNIVDDLFSTNDRDITIGFRLDSDGLALQLVAERNALTELMTVWAAETQILSYQDDIIAALTLTAERTDRVQAFVNTLNGILDDASPAGSISATTLSALRNDVQTARNTTDDTLSSLVAAGLGVRNAEESLEKAQLADTGSVASASDAQVKQALGSLRAAQARLEKTILRSPIAGTVNTLSIDVGDFSSAFSPVAIIANNNALEITTFVGESDRNAITVGQSVMIEENLPGTITNIAPAIDSATRKIEVKIATEADLVTGDTVTITVSEPSQSVSEEGPLFVPITAVRFTDTAGSVFTVENNKLVSYPVEIGLIRGEFVEISTGIERNTLIVTDARGLTAGNEVDALTN